MLLDRAAKLATKITQYQKLEAAAAEVEHFQTRASQFDTLSERIAGTRAALDKLKNAGVEISFTPSDGKGYAAKAKTLRTAVEENPAVINDPPFNLKHEFTDRISGIATAAEKAMADAWKVYVTKRADFGSDHVLSALAAVPQFRPSVTKIQQCRSNIKALSNRLPTDPPTTIAKLDALVAEHDIAWASLSADNIPPTVISFIRAAANEGAPLTDYSDEVRAWLEGRNLVHAFRIRLR